MMKKVLSNNYKLAAKLSFLSIIGYIIYFFLDEEIVKSGWELILYIILSLFFSVGIGLLISKGITWVKFILLLLSFFNVILFFFNPKDYYKTPQLLIFSILSSALEIYILILLFKKSPKKEEDVIKKSI